MLNRLTQLANLIGNLNIVKTFQNRHGSNTASAVAKRYNDEQDLIRNEMGKIGNASDEYRQLAALLRESEQEEQKTVTALTYDGESDDFKDSSLKADSAVEKLNSFSSKDSNLATLLNARTGIIQNIVAKQNELNNATDNSQAEQIKAEIEKLYDEKSKAEEDIYDYIKDNPTYENVAGDLKTAIDGANQAKGNNGAQTPAAGNKPNAKHKETYLDGIKPADSFNVPIDSEAYKEVKLADLGTMSLKELQDTQTALIEDENANFEAQNQYDTAKGNIDSNIANIGGAIEGIIKLDANNEVVSKKLKQEATDKVEEINTTKDGIDKKQNTIKDEETNLANAKKSLSSLHPPYRGNYESEEEYNAVKSDYDKKAGELKQKISDTEKTLEQAHKDLEQLEEDLVTQCEALEELKAQILKCIENKDGYDAAQKLLIDNNRSCKDLAEKYTEASSKLEQQKAQNYANINAVNAEIAARNQELESKYTKDEDDMSEDEKSKARAIAYALEYSQMSDAEKTDNSGTLKNLCMEAGYGYKENDKGEIDLDYIFDQARDESKDNQTDEQS